MYENIKERVWKANLQLPALGLVILTWGNASCIDRELGVIAIKPSGIQYDKLKPEDIIICDLNGKVVDGCYRPSSDLATHLCLYKAFPEIQSVIHTHSKWATIWAQATRDIPIYGTTHADYFYGDIPCTKPMEKQQILDDYEWNTGEQIITTFQERHLSTEMMNAVLVSGHGPFVWGDCIDNAVENALVLEYIAEMAYHRECLNQTPKNLLSQEILKKHYFRKHGKDAYYGQ